MENYDNFSSEFVKIVQTKASFLLQDIIVNLKSWLQSLFPYHYRIYKHSLLC